MKTIFYLIAVSLILWGCESLIFEDDTYDYSIEQQMDCFCPQHGVWVKLFVSTNTVSKAIRISDDYRLSYDEYKYYKPIKGLFEITHLDTTLYYLEFTMDSSNSYPAYVHYTPKATINGDTLAYYEDAELSYTTKNYKKLR